MHVMKLLCSNEAVVQQWLEFTGDEKTGKKTIEKKINPLNLHLLVHLLDTDAPKQEAINEEPMPFSIREMPAG